MRIGLLRNLLFCNRWSFRLLSVKHSRAVARPGATVHVTGIVENDGMRLGSAYVRVRIADPYDHSMVVFDSDEGLEYRKKQSLRIIDLPVGATFRFSVPWRIDASVPEGVYYYRVEIWNIPKLFSDRRCWLRYRNHCFDRSPWTPGIEILHQGGATPSMKCPKAFISYSWDSTEHQDWVMELADHLLRNGVDVIVDRRDLSPGEEITEFIERGISESDILLFICSEEYKKKADARLGGVGMETVISTSQFLNARRTKKFIPVTRNNQCRAKDKLPTYLGSTLYVDMDVDDWQGAPLQELLVGIFKETETEEHRTRGSGTTS